MKRILNLDTILDINENTNIEYIKNIYSRLQNIKFKCKQCNNIAFLKVGILWKRTDLLCTDCYIRKQSKCYLNKNPINISEISKIQKPIAPTQKIKFICENCNIETIKQFRNYQYCNLCEHCKKSKASTINQNNPIVKAKKDQTNIKKYGTKYPSQSIEVRNKIKNTKAKITLEQWKKINKKTAKTNIERYGEKTPLLNKDIKIKTKQTLLLKYGVDNIRKSQYYKNLYEKYCDVWYLNKKSLYLYETIYFDSSWELIYYIWLKDKNINFIYHPKPGLTYNVNNKKHKYYPDFFIENKYYEIKGNQFFDKNGNFKINNVQDKEKYNCMIKNNVIILTYKELQPIMKYIFKKYSYEYIQSFKVKK